MCKVRKLSTPARTPSEPYFALFARRDSLISFRPATAHPQRAGFGSGTMLQEMVRCECTGSLAGQARLCEAS